MPKAQIKLPNELRSFAKVIFLLGWKALPNKEPINRSNVPHNLKHRRARAGMISLVERRGIEITATGDSQEGIDLAMSDDPNVSADVILLDQRMPVMTGKTVVASDLTSAVKDGDTTGENAPASPFSSLTPRESEILRHLAEGQSNQVIARHLNISDGTVKLHVKAILRKLEVHARVEAAVMAVEPDSAYVKKGFKRDDLFVCVDKQFMPQTAAMADIVLPARSFVEHTDLYTSFGHTYIQVAEPLIKSHYKSHLGADHQHFRRPRKKRSNTLLD